MPGVSSMITSTAGDGLERPDVAALAADDAALHVVGRELDHRHGGGGGVAGGEPADAGRDDVADAAVGLLLGLLLDAADHLRHVVADVVLGLLERALAGLRLGHARRALELADGRVLGRLQLVLQRAGCTSRSLMPCSRRVSSAFFWSSWSSRALARSSARATSSGAARAAPRSPARTRSWSSLACELGLLAQGIGVALRVFEQRLGLQGVGLGPHPGELLLQEESDRSAYEKRAPRRRPQPRGRPRNHLSPRPQRGVCQIRRRRGRAPVGNHAAKGIAKERDGEEPDR